MTLQDIRVFRYNRGEEYSVDVIVYNKNNLTYKNIKKPKDVGMEIINSFIEEASKKVKSLLESYDKV